MRPLSPERVAQAEDLVRRKAAAEFNLRQAKGRKDQGTPLLSGALEQLRQAEAAHTDDLLYQRWCYASSGERLMLTRDGKRVVLEGRAICWDTLSRRIEDFHEVVRPGAFRWDNDCALVSGGHRGETVAAVANGLLKIEQADDGLRFSAILPDSIAGRRLVRIAETSRGCSVKFRHVPSLRHSWKVEVRAAELLHIAVLAAPANPAHLGTYLNLRHIAPVPEVERHFRRLMGG